jgi:nitrogen regulatory protein PII
MQWIQLIVPVQCADRVRESLARIRPGTLVLGDAATTGSGTGSVQRYRGQAYRAATASVKLEFAVSDGSVDHVLKAAADAIEETPGAELLVVVSKVDDVVRIRNGPCGIHMR